MFCEVTVEFTAIKGGILNGIGDAVLFLSVNA
jgi:hypothetical protein